MKSLKFLVCAVALLATPLVSLVAAEGPNEKAANVLKLEKFVMPEFPEYVRLAGITQGAVTIAIGRDNEGRVNDVLVLDSSNARFTQSVVNAVQQWRFKFPADPSPGILAVVPVVRVLFTAKGVSVVQAITGTLANKDNISRPNEPIRLPTPAELDAPLKPVMQPMPRITGVLRSRMGEGMVTMKYFIDAEGKVRVPVVLEASAPELGQAAAAALAKWQFEPPQVGGRPTIAINTETFVFGTRAQL